jgi:hypothetical protein
MSNVIYVDFRCHHIIEKSKWQGFVSLSFRQGKVAASVLRIREADARLKYLADLNDIEFPTLPKAPFKKDTPECIEWWTGFWEGYRDQ